MARKALLVCGILSSLVYVAADVLGALRWEGYHYTSQAISELSAIGAPSRPLVVALGLLHTVLVIAFGWGVWWCARGSRRLRAAGGLLLGIGALGLTAPLFPMHQRGAGMSLTDTMHIALTSVTVLLILLAIWSASEAFGPRFRRYSLGTILVLVVFGALTGLAGPRVAANQPTPWMGVTERINVGGYLLWQVVLAVALLRLREASASGGTRVRKPVARTYRPAA